MTYRKLLLLVVVVFNTLSCSGTSYLIEVEKNSIVVTLTSLRDALSLYNVDDDFLIKVKFLNEATSNDKLILPPIWQDIQVKVNDNNEIYLADSYERQPGKGKIFRHLIYHIPKTNRIDFITIRGTKKSNLINFRSDFIYVGKFIPYRILAENFLINDIHSFLIAASMLLGFLLFIIGIATKSISTSLFGVSFFLMIPHHLLSTSFYSLLKVDLDTVFKGHLLSVFCFYPTIYHFFYERLSPKGFIQKILKPKNVYMGFLVLIIPLLITAIVYDLNNFQNIVVPTTLVFFIISILMIVKSSEVNIFLFLFLTGISISMLTPISDILSINMYLLGYGIFLMQTSGIYLLVKDYLGKVNAEKAFNSLIQYTLPKSLHFVINNAFKNSDRNDEIINNTNKQGLLTVMLIDICEWGLMSHSNGAMIPDGILNKAKVFLFKKLEEIVESKNIEFVKGLGDAVLFVGGAYQNIELKKLYKDTLQAALEIISSLSDIKRELNENSLPAVDIKIAISGGFCEYGLMKYMERIQYDISGNSVNFCFRIMDEMDSSFYKRIGKNAILVHEDLIKKCEDLDVRRRFKPYGKLTDKHSLEYECYFSVVENPNISAEDVKKAVYGLYALDNKLKEQKDEDKETKRNFNRRVNYNRYIKAKIRRLNDDEIIDAQIYDLSSDGISCLIDMEISFKKREVVYIKIISDDDQEIELKSILWGIDKIEKQGKHVNKIAFRFLNDKRTSSERSMERFEIDGLQAYFIFNGTKERFVNCKIANVSKEGLQVFLDNDDYLFLPTMKCQIIANVPMYGEVKLKCEIRYIIKKHNIKIIGVGIADKKNKEKYLEALGTFLANMCGHRYSIKKIRKEGFLISDLSKILTSELRPSHKIDDILKLRLDVWQSEGEFYGESHEIMRDEFDDHSRHIILKINEKIVGSIRVVFNDGDIYKSENYKYGYNIPDWIMSSNFVEVSRAVVHPEYRNGEIFFRLIYESGIVVGEIGSKYCLINCDPKLENIYKSIGFKTLQVHQDSQDILMFINFLEVVKKSKDASITGWALVMSDIRKELKRTQEIENLPFPPIQYLFKESLKHLVIKSRKKRSKRIS